MELSFILLIIGFIVVTYLIFKFIKKIIVAIFSFIFLILLIVGSVAGLVYLDMNNLASQNDFNVNLIYGSSETPQFGFTIRVENKSLNEDSLSSFNIATLKDIDYDESEDFYVFMSEDLFNSLLSSDGEYYLIGTEDLEIMGFEIETKLTKNDVLNILNSDDALDTYVTVLVDENDLPAIFKNTGKEAIRTYIKAELKKRNIEFNEALFGSILLSEGMKNQNVVKLIEGFKEGTLEVYPDRITFKLLRLMPIDLILNYVPDQVLESAQE